MHMEFADELRWIVHLPGVIQLQHDREGLPGTIRLEPREVVLRVLRHQVNLFLHLICERRSLDQR